VGKTLQRCGERPGPGLFRESQPGWRQSLCDWYSRGATGQGFLTVAYSAASGATAWMGSYTDPNNGPDTALQSAVSPSGNAVVVTGYGHDSVKEEDLTTVAYNTAAAALWIRRYLAPGGTTPAKRAGSRSARMGARRTSRKWPSGPRGGTA
jgi:hypothetical protein